MTVLTTIGFIAALLTMPDLLEALKSALELIEIISPLEGDDVRKARAAIAKATGDNND